MTYVSNLLLTSFLNGLSPYKESTRLSPKLNYLRVLGFKVCIFVHEKKQKIKSTK